MLENMKKFRFWPRMVLCLMTAIVVSIIETGMGMPFWLQLTISMLMGWYWGRILDFLGVLMPLKE